MAGRLATFLGFFFLLLARSSAFGRTTAQAEEECVEFLLRYMPETDKLLLDRDFLVKNARFALAARERTAWAAGVPWTLFLNDVLPYAVLNEKREDWRAFFFESLSPLVTGAAGLRHAATAINARIWDMWNLRFVAGQTPQTMSPFQNSRMERRIRRKP